MRPDLPWNVAGIPPEAREAARAAARREGLSVGEWLTRRILRSFSDAAPDLSNGESHEWWEERDEKPASRRDTEEMLAHVSRTENDAQNAYRRIEEQLRTFARRMDAAERNQTENTRAMSKAAAEINVATREQAQAFDQLGSTVTNLSDRMDRVERHANAEHLKDAVKGLHQGLTRIADQVSQTANHSAAQISSLADNLESVAGRMATARQDLDAVAQAVDSRHAHVEDRLRGVEKLIETNAQDIARLAAGTSAVVRLEESIARLEARSTDPAVERRLSGIERTLSDVAARIDLPDRSSALAEEKIRALALRLDATEKTQRETTQELRNAIAALAPQPETPKPASAGFAAAQAPAPPVAAPSLQHPVFDNPPFADDAFPQNAPRASKPVDSFTSPPFAAAAVFEAPTDQLPAADPFPPLAAFGDGTAAASAAQPNSFLDVAAPLVQPDSFLAAARRSAQAAAAQAEAERMNRGFGGFAWATQGSSRSTEPRSRYGLVGLIVLAVVLLAVAGILFSQRLPAPEQQRTGDVPSAFTGKQTAPVVLKPTTPANEISTAPSAPTPAPAASIPARAPLVTTTPRTAPSSPVLPPAKVHRLAAAPLQPMAQQKAPATKVTQPVQTVQTSPKQPAPAPTKQATAMPLDRLTQLANAGNPKAETIVGLRYLDGNGVPVNEAESAKWLERAANHGQAVAQYRLGTLYERGRGVPADGAKALHWYQAAAQSGNRKAMHNLAVAYAQGSGVPKDFAEAARWFSKAAALGLADSQFNLAVLYERGLGVPQSLLDAYKWYAIAAAQGDAESKSRIGAIATQLSADDRAAAQRSADQFKPAPLDASANVPPQLGDIAG